MKKTQNYTFKSSAGKKAVLTLYFRPSEAEAIGRAVESALSGATGAAFRRSLRGKRSKYTDSMIQSLYQRYTKGETLGEIAESEGRSISGIKNLFERMGLPRRPPGPSKGVRPETLETARKVREMRESGMSDAEIAKKMGLTRARIHQLRKLV